MSTPETEIQTTETTEARPELKLQDLLLTVQTIQAMSQRGAIRADELTTIGGLHDRLVAFLEASGVITRTPPAEQAQDTEQNQEASTEA